MTLKNIYDRKGWFDWPAQYRDREHAAMARLRREAEEQIEYERFVQYVFFGQWLALKKYCNQSGIRMVGDAPIYVSYDSVDVWANAELFKLGERKRPRVVAGVPPDYFSETGQLWGNPVYDWERMQQNGFAWWIKRIGQNLTLYDAVRLDHFRGFAACWEVPADEKTAVNGKWVESPGNELFTALHRRFLALPIIAEDLGYITADVRELKDAWGFPGMRVLQFGFGGDLSRNIHAPHNHTRDSVVYTGTHDNNTVKGWFEEEASEDDRRQFLRYAGRTVFDNGIHQEFVRMAMISVADTVIFPIQDLLGLGSEGRMNTPSTAEGNWGWRLLPQEADPAALEWFADMTRFFGRC
jgi:4-alpha-glucanotransferase